jgi:thiamine biosynthesis protein ThiS
MSGGIFFHFPVRCFGKIRIFASMKICFNNENITTQAADLAALIAERLPGVQGIAVAVGTSVVPRDRWDKTPLTEGCSITVIRATRGG